MRTDIDVVVVGAGVGGSAIAAALARNGIKTLLLERTAEHYDRIRGEYLAPWGVAETQKLGLYSDLIAAGGHHTKLAIPYSEGVSPEMARNRAIDLTSAYPGVLGGLCMQHVVTCNTLNRSAQQAGAEIIRPAERIEVTAGIAPEVRFLHDGQSHHIRCHLVVGADGRGSSVARQARISFRKDPPHHLLTGLLVEGVEDWPEDIQSVGVEGDVMFFVFPQGSGRARLYLGFGREQSRRFTGPGSANRFLEAFRLRCVPSSEILAAGKPIGHCQSYPNEDMWCDEPVAPGIVLIGDAAGHNDPTIGQGLAITFRDARFVSEILLNEKIWAKEAFRPYVEERAERMKRLRFVGRLVSTLRAEFDQRARVRRQLVAERLVKEPSLALPLRATIHGPEALPAEAFEQRAWDQLMGERAVH